MDHVRPDLQRDIGIGESQGAREARGVGTFAYRANCRRRENSLDVSVVRGSERVGTHISGESLLVILLVGVIAGWLAGKIVEAAVSA